MSNMFNGSDLDKAIVQITGGGLMAPRVDIRPELFDIAIKQKGYRILWEQGMFCSCYPTNSGQPDYTCTACKGKGYIYFDPKEIRAIVTSINGRKEQQKIGLDEMGTAYLTAPSEHNIGFRDRFTFLDFTTKFSEVLVRDNDNQGGYLDELRYPAKSIISVRSRNTIFVRGTHFNLTEDGKSIQWSSDYLYAGDQFSVLYTTNPVYIAIGPIHELRGTYNLSKGKGLEIFHQLPKQFQIKREDFLDE